MLLLQHHLDLIKTFLSGLRGVMRFGGGALALLVICAGVSSGQSLSGQSLSGQSQSGQSQSGQSQSASEDAFSSAPWQSPPRTSRALQWRSVSPQGSARSAVRDVSRKATKSERKPASYDKKVVQTSGDESYVLDPVPANQMAGHEMAGHKMAGPEMAGPEMAGPEMAGHEMMETVGEPMVMPGGGMYGNRMYGNRRYGAFSDPAIDHPWEGGEYWFNPRHGMLSVLCRYPLWMGFARERMWFRGEYLLWWMSGSDTPAIDGADKMNTGAQSGGRVSLGYWFTDEQCFGMELNYLGIGKSEDDFHADSVDLDATAEFQSFEFLFRRAMVQRCDYRADFLFGYRYGRLDDYSQVTNGERQLTQNYETINKFSGAELGMSLNRRKGRWAYELLMKLALGRISSQGNIDGTLYESKEFSVMPEMGLNLMYSLTPRTSFTVGYHLIYLSHVARAGDQIDMTEFPMRTTDFWAHGLNLGFDVRF